MECEIPNRSVNYRVVRKDGEKEIGYINAHQADEGKLVVYSTYVDPAYRGGSIAKDMALELFQYAREHKLSLESHCSYITRIIEKGLAE